MYSPTLGRFVERNPWNPMLFNQIPPPYSPFRYLGWGIRGYGVGSYIQSRFCLYDYALGDPANRVEPFSEAPPITPPHNLHVNIISDRQGRISRWWDRQSDMENIDLSDITSPEQRKRAGNPDNGKGYGSPSPGGKDGKNEVGDTLDTVLGRLTRNGIDCISVLRIGGHGDGGAGITTSVGGISDGMPDDQAAKIKKYLCPGARIDLCGCHTAQYVNSMIELGKKLGASKVCGCTGLADPGKGCNCDGEWKCVDVPGGGQ